MIRLFLILFLIPGLAQAQELLAELSSHKIVIETDFRGAELMLFGSVASPIKSSDNLVVVVRGPKQDLKVRRKEKVGPIWVNRKEATFTKVPAFYRLYTLYDPSNSLSQTFRQWNQIGLENVRLTGTGDDVPAMKAALINDKKQDLLFADRYEHATQNLGDITLLNSYNGPALFYLTVQFPQTVPVGNYLVEIFLIRNGNVAAAQTTPLQIFKDGIGAEIALFASRHGLWYGILGVIIAIFSGWLAAHLFGKK